MKNKKLRILFVMVGALCLLGAGGLRIYTEYSEGQAQEYSKEIVAEFGQVFAQQGELDKASTDTDTAKIELLQESSTINILGEEYLGLLSIPQLGLELPVCAYWSDALLIKTPCVFSGSREEGNLIIVAHNYQAHFGTIYQLELGDEISLLDSNGNYDRYLLIATEQLSGDDQESLQAGEWDLTLSTCLYGNNTQRVVLRFSLIQ